MAVDPTKAIKPLTHVFVGVTVPAEGSRLTLVDGVPGSGREVGALEGPIEWNAPHGEDEFDSETHESPLDYSSADNALEMKVKMKEFSAENLKMAIQGDNFVTPDGGTLIGAGTKTELTSRSVVAVWETKAGTGVYGYGMIHDGIFAGGVNVGFTKEGYTVVELTIKAKPVTTRTSGFDLGELYVPPELT